MCSLLLIKIAIENTFAKKELYCVQGKKTPQLQHLYTDYLYMYFRLQMTLK